MPSGLLYAAALPVAGSTLEFLPVADSLQEWSSLQHRWNLLHTPHLHSWGLATKKEKGMNVVAVVMTLPQFGQKATLRIQGIGPRRGLI